jgi:hypothetical protein
MGEDVGSNAGILLQHYVASQPRRPQLEYTRLFPLNIPATVAKPSVMTACISDLVRFAMYGLNSNGDSVWNQQAIGALTDTSLCISVYSVHEIKI